jgi:hypothetical protein
MFHKNKYSYINNNKNYTYIHEKFLSPILESIRTPWPKNKDLYKEEKINKWNELNKVVTSILIYFF